MIETDCLITKIFNRMLQLRVPVETFRDNLIWVDGIIRIHNRYNKGIEIKWYETMGGLLGGLLGEKVLTDDKEVAEFVYGKWIELQPCSD